MLFNSKPWFSQQSKWLDREPLVLVCGIMDPDASKRNGPSKLLGPFSSFAVLDLVVHSAHAVHAGHSCSGALLFGFVDD